MPHLLSRFLRVRLRPRSLAGQLFAMQVVVVAAVLAGCSVLAWLDALSQAEETAQGQVTAVAESMAASPTVRAAVSADDPTAVLQPYAEQVRRATSVTFVTVMAPDGTRYTHPNPEEIGGRFVGHTAPALAGRTFTETYTGTLGPSVRAVAPVRDGGRITALVSSGIAVETISARVSRRVVVLVAVAAGALAAGGTATYVVNARLRRHTRGMGAAELGRMYDYHQATLHAVREGLVLLDADRRVALCNDAGRELLGLRESPQGRGAAELDLPESLTGALLADEPRVDEVHLTAERVVVVNTAPVRSPSRTGTVVTLRDHTELQALAGELDSVRGFSEALRAQAHEAANRLHTVVSLIELGRADEAVEFATAELRLAQELTDQVVQSVAEPVLAALLLGKAAEANERGVELVVTGDSRIDDGVIPPALGARDLVTVLGNLVDNAVDAAIEGTDRGRGRPRVTVTARTGDGELLVRVADTGRGVDPDEIGEVFRRGWSTKGPGAGGGGRDGSGYGSGDGSGDGSGGPGRVHGRGLGLALVAQAARRNGGTVTVGREVGAVFTVRIPLEPSSGRPAGTAAEGGGA